MKLTDIRQPDYFHKVVDCQWACPAHTPVPEYIRLIADRPLQRRLHDQLEVQRVSRHSRAHLRPAVRAGLPARPGREGAGGDLPAEARRRRLQGRHPRPPAEAGGAPQRQAHRAGRRRPGLADRRARSRAARLQLRDVRRRPAGRRHDAHADPEIPPARIGDRRGVRLHPRPRHRVPRRPTHRQPEGAAGRRLRRGLRRLRRAARARPRHPRPPGSGQEHPYRHRLAVAACRSATSTRSAGA